MRAILSKVSSGGAAAQEWYKLRRLSYCGRDFARATNCLTFCKSLVWLPSSLSVLVLNQLPAGRTALIASTTLSGPSPPAMMTGIFTLSTIFLSISQLWVTPSAPICLSSG